MSRLETAMNRLDALLSAPMSWTQGTKIYEPLPDDPNGQLKNHLIERGANAMRLGEATRNGMKAPVPLLENELYFQIGAVSELDAEKNAFIELINATQEVLSAINETAA